MTIMTMGVLSHWSQASSFEPVVRQRHWHPHGRQNRGESRKGDWNDRSPKTYELTLFTMVGCNSENSIRSTRPFCQPLFCHRSVVKYTSSLLK